MAATLSEPFLLSSYGLAKSLPRNVVELNRESTYVYSTHGEGSKSLDGYATITAQGDGVHVMDISSIHPVTSHTLGPSITFSCPAVSRITPEGGITTYAVIESSSELKQEERSRVIWMWHRKLDGSLDVDSRNKHTAVMSHTISKLYLPDDLPSRVVVLSPNGDMSIIDSELDFKSTLQTSDLKRVLLKSFIFSYKACSFLSHKVSITHGSVIISIFALDDSIHVEVVLISEDDAIVRLGNCQLPFDKEIAPKTINGISCSASGLLSILTLSGAWHPFQLECVNEAYNLSPLLDIINLTSLSAIAPASHHGTSQKSQTEISLLSLGSSFVLLAGITRTPARDIVILLWDLQYSVVLSSHTLPIPSALTQADKKGLSLELVGAGTTQAILVLTPSNNPLKGKSSDTTSSLRSTVLVVPFTTPLTSTIAGAMGRASGSAKWIFQDESLVSQPSELDDSQISLLQTMRTTVDQNRPEGASTAFFEWVQNTRASQGKQGAPNGQQQSDVVLCHEFVEGLLDIVLQPTRAYEIPYSPKVVHFLLERQVVSGSMVNEGFLAVLRLRNDWQSIFLALNTVPDIAEDEIVSTLTYVVAQHRKGGSHTSRDDTAMQVDSEASSNIPSLPTFLSSCVLYNTSPAALRVAIRKHLSDVDDIICLLEVLDDWIAGWNTITLKLLPAGVVKNQKGIFVPKLHSAKIDTPQLGKVLSFLQTMLDASFLSLLQHPSAHNLLRRMSSTLEPELNRIDQMEQLRGPLEPFARAQMKALRESVEGKRDNQVDWRRRKKAAHQQAAVAVGLYRLEELVL